jgi:hypothetical protein
MAQSKFTLYKYIKLADGSWRYCKAAFYSNAKIKPNRCIVGGKEEEHPEGSYYLYHKKSWIPVGADALDAQRQRSARLDDEEFKRLRGTAPVSSLTMSPISSRSSLAVAVRKQLKLMIERGLYRDIDMSCHVSQETRAGERLPDEGVRVGNRGTVPRRQDSACRHVRRRSAFLRRSGHTVLLQP